jgi:hypothetical protein
LILIGNVNHSFHLLDALKAAYDVVTGIVKGLPSKVATTEQNKPEVCEKLDSFFAFEGSMNLFDSLRRGLVPSSEVIFTLSGRSMSFDVQYVTLFEVICFSLCPFEKSISLESS